MPLADLLAHAAMLSAPLDPTDLAPLRARLFARLRDSGWAPSGYSRGAPSAAESDAALLAAFVRGDPTAFDALFDRHAPRLNGHARRWLQSADAADAVQDSFLVLFEKAPALLERGDLNLGAYLFATLRHKVLDILAARETPVADLPGADESSSEDDGLVAVLRREDAARLADLLDRTCSPLEQHVLLLDLDDRDGAEIAASLAITPGHVRVLRHRALTRLRQAFESTGEAPRS